jgi:BolA protein
MSNMPELIKARLVATFSPTECVVEDDSALHAGHAGAASGGGHYRIRLVTTLFEGKNRISRHRLVYDCLSELFKKEIHALAIAAYTPSELAD